MSSSAPILNDCQTGDCVKQPSSSTSGGNTRKRKRSRPSTSVARQPSPSEENANRSRPKRTTSRRATSESPLVHGTCDVRPLPTGRGRGGGSRKVTSSRTYKGPSSSSAAEELVLSSETKDREDTGVTEDGLTPAERDIPDTQLLCNLGKHPSVYARSGQVRHIAIYYFSSSPSFCLVE